MRAIIDDVFYHVILRFIDYIHVCYFVIYVEKQN